MSRHHARFYFDADGAVWIEDLGSTNGTFVNGKRIDQPCRLALGDQIRLSSTMLELVAASADAPEPAAARPDPVAARPEPAAKRPAARVPRLSQPRQPSLIARWKEQRTQRAALPPFPNYTQIPSVLSIRRVVGGPRLRPACDAGS